MTASEEMLILERHHAEAFMAERVVPGADVHADPDVTWMLHHGSTWRNAAIMVRFSPTTAPRRLDTLLRRYERHGRGFGLWVSPLSQPANLAALLQQRGLRCKKHFPGMMRDLTASPVRAPPNVELTRVTDVAQFKRVPHPEPLVAGLPKRDPRAIIESVNANHETNKNGP
jgi:hypothetical protein